MYRHNQYIVQRYLQSITKSQQLHCKNKLIYSDDIVKLNKLCLYHECMRLQQVSTTTLNNNKNNDNKQLESNNNNSKSTLSELRAIQQEFSKQLRTNPRLFIQESYTHDKYLWWVLICAICMFGCVHIYKQYYQPITLHDTVKQTLDFINQSELYKKYLKQTNQYNDDDIESNNLQRGVYVDGKQSYRRSHLVWKNYTPNGSTVYIACDGVNISYKPKIDIKTGQYVDIDTEKRLLSNSAKTNIMNNSLWKLINIRVYFDDIKQCYNYDFSNNRFILSNDNNDLDVFYHRTSSDYIGELGSDEFSSPSYISHAKMLENKRMQNNNNNVDNTLIVDKQQQQLKWHERFSLWLSDSKHRMTLLAGLVSIPLVIGMYNRQKYINNSGFRLIRSRLDNNSNNTLNRLFGPNNYTISNTYAGTVNRRICNFTVDVKNKHNGSKLGNITIQAVNGNEDYKQGNEPVWYVRYAEVKPVNKQAQKLDVWI